MKETRQNNNKGFAVVYAIGVLALVFALALGFFETSRTNLKMASNNEQEASANMLLQTSVNRTLAVLDYELANSGTIGALYSTSNTSTDTHGIDKLTTTIDDINYYDYYCDPDSDKIAWEYFLKNGDADSNQLDGRIAYVVLDNLGKLDPGACVDSGMNAKLAKVRAISENDYAYTSVALNGTKIVGRPGVDLNEISLRNLYGHDPDTTTNCFTASQLKNISSNIAEETPGLLPENGRWGSFTEFLNALGINTKKGEVLTKEKAVKDANLVYDWTNFSTYPDMEAFWIDTDTNGKPELSEFYHRFNLARNDWDNLTPDSFLNSSPILYNTPATDTNILAIPWLKNWNVKGTFADTEACKKQVIANLIDYCKSSYAATTDNADSPTYTGNNKTPYINEIGAFVYCLMNHVNNTRFSFRLSASRLGAELINMYGLNDGGQNVTKLEILPDSYFKFKFTTKDSNNKDYSEFCTFYLSLSQPIGSRIINPYTTMDWGTFRFYNSDTKQYVNTITTSMFTRKSKAQVTVSDFELYLRVRLYYDHSKSGNYTFADFANIKKTDNISNVSFTIADVRKTIFFAFEADDPRQNLNIGDWTSNSSIVNNQQNELEYGVDKKSKIGTPGVKNSCVTCNNASSPNYDIETTADSDPCNVSTAYIRKAPMKSPWELGFIHRGVKWQTLNLAKYNTDVDGGVGPMAGGADYSKGDANILDQIKMTSTTETYGKIDVNGPKKYVSKLNPEDASVYKYYPDVLRALFMGIYYKIGKQNYNDPGTQIGSIINKLYADVIAADLIKGSTAGEYKTRAQILRPNNGISTLFTQNPDLTNKAEQDEIIGKFINLTKVNSPNKYTIIILVQKIKNYNGIMSRYNKVTKKVETYHCEYGKFTRGGDEILSEQKLLVTVEKNAKTNKWNISNYMYLE